MASMRDSTKFRGKRVSRAHAIVLEAAADAGIDFTLNSGRRTMAEQAQMVREKGVWSPSNPHGAARPNANAPHIKAPRGTALAHHALDIDTRAGGNRRVASFYARHGVPVRFNVPPEPWHMDTVDEAKLIAAAHKLDDPLREYPADERRWIHEYDELRDANRDLERRRVLIRTMKARRKSIWRAAQDSGWNRLHRRERYHSLLART